MFIWQAKFVAGMALGMVMQLPDQDDETSVSRRQLLAKLDVCMGGRVAEELIFGESNITTGEHNTAVPSAYDSKLSTSMPRPVNLPALSH